MQNRSGGRLSMIDRKTGDWIMTKINVTNAQHGLRHNVEEKQKVKNSSRQLVVA
jgi:hypothetical protein